ncbi:MAG: RecX family transcriptional regulator [Peptoniphilus harei]|uniref:regulatory protein RecX n=1 Tax=Peptoniphilus TaxID=162289 RepID=UPI0011DCC58D|nr:RecX family transcriptional regulator [Peptoniphilus harei]MDK7755198.1 RecX family transcriptional regulator [Peptoniphilus harei]MDK7761005.1 RecX family transcriptional regulator [Peptoniphilus harei]MDK8270795.1 RecX family transcriptional regulator [Peptoniphilus harei]MDK8339178.1 RecX family transcriptional regulator [Peptoniphilus harei]MDU2502677.1 RecX family transcriptional regulator [Peptoniphilus harei]
MIISNISFEKKKFHVSFDNGEEIKISEDTLVNFGLYKGQEVEEEFVENLKFEDEKSEALLLSYKFLQRNKTKQQLVDYLYKNKIQRDIIDIILPILEEKNYLNDEDYARRYLSDALNIKKYGKIKTRYMLMSKGIDKKIIEKVMEDYDYELEYMNALELIEKRISKDETDPKIINSAKNYLQGRGFEFEIINFTLDDYLGVE